MSRFLFFLFFLAIAIVCVGYTTNYVLGSYARWKARQIDNNVYSREQRHNKQDVLERNKPKATKKKVIKKKVTKKKTKKKVTK